MGNTLQNTLPSAPLSTDRQKCQAKSQRHCLTGFQYCQNLQNLQLHAAAHHNSSTMGVMVQNTGSDGSPSLGETVVIQGGRG